MIDTKDDRKLVISQYCLAVDRWIFRTIDDLNICSRSDCTSCREWNDAWLEANEVELYPFFLEQVENYIRENYKTISKYVTIEAWPDKWRKVGCDIEVREHLRYYCTFGWRYKMRSTWKEDLDKVLKKIIKDFNDINSNNRIY